MKAQLVTDHVRVQVDTHGPDMSELLRDIRSQYESAAKKNREEAEAWYNSKVSIWYTVPCVCEHCTTCWKIVKLTCEKCPKTI